ncbi:MAG: hypothetical protein BMS9Abin29_1625 [Gemmatimonadota bacterium]|nr:MAG: hypothetical protein BMS9Abin29_1625 [Gemmatimonadota bacterium]
MASYVERYGRSAALLLVVVGLLVRIPGTMEWWLNPDEGIYFSILTQPTLSAFWKEVAENAHPPLYYMLLRAVGILTTDFFWYRALSLAAGAAAVYALWECGREIAWEAPVRRTVTGLVAAALLVSSPPAVTLSQIMRPYMLQLVLVAGALALLLRFGRAPERRTLLWYLVFIALALLTHYSSILALGALGGVALYLILSPEMPREARRDLALAHIVPVTLVLVLYLFHLRGLVASDTADDALQGWLSFYLVGSPREAWLAFVGLQTTVGGRGLGGPITVLTIAALAAAVARRAWLPVVVAGSALLVGLVAAAAGVYPMGAVRHSTWMLAFTLPALAWGVGFVLTSGRRWAAVGVAVVVVLMAARERVGIAMDVPDSPWAAPERVLRRENLLQMLDLLDPAGAPRLVVMDLQTFYLLLPFYFTEREAARPGPEDTFFHFRYGARDVVVVRSWLLTAGADLAQEESNLRSLADRVDRSPTPLGMASASEVQVLVGGWRSNVVDQLLALEDSGVVTNHRLVPGLFAFLVNMERLNAPATPPRIP